MQSLINDNNLQITLLIDRDINSPAQNISSSEVNLAARSVTKGTDGVGALELGHPQNNHTVTILREWYIAEIRQSRVLTVT